MLLERCRCLGISSSLQLRETSSFRKLCSSTLCDKGICSLLGRDLTMTLPHQDSVAIYSPLTALSSISLASSPRSFPISSSLLLVCYFSVKLNSPGCREPGTMPSLGSLLLRTLTSFMVLSVIYVQTSQILRSILPNHLEPLQRYLSGAGPHGKAAFRASSTVDQENTSHDIKALHTR
jgi:hypothetical protein